MNEWEPATEAENAMRDALRAGDQELYFRILARSELLLPVSNDALAGRAPIGWGTWTTGARTHVLAFTSTEAMRVCLADHAGSARRIAYHELASQWPNLEWWLAVDPGLPIEGYLPAWFVSQLARGDIRLPGRTLGARARVERVESFQRARAVASVPGRALATQPAAPDTVPAQPSPERPRSVRATAPVSPAHAPGDIAAALGGDTGVVTGFRGTDLFGPTDPAPVPPPADLFGLAGQAPVPPPADLLGLAEPASVPPPPAPSEPAAESLLGLAPDTEPPSRRSTATERPSRASGLSNRGSAAAAAFAGRGAAAAARAGSTSPESLLAAAQVPPPLATQPSETTFPAEAEPLLGSPPAPPAEPLLGSPPAPPAEPPTAEVPGHYIVPPPVPAPEPAVSAPPPVEEPPFTPANEVEESLLAAADEGNTDSFLSTLLLAKVLLPLPAGGSADSRPGDPSFVWRTETMEDHPYIVVFTSPERLVEHIGETRTTVEVRFAQLIRHWPDEQWSFAVNPGTPVGAKLPGTQIVALASWAAEVGLGDEPADEPVVAAEPVEAPSASSIAAGAPANTDLIMMQKVIPPSQVNYYLDRGYDRVSGFVQRASEVAHLRTPAQLHAALGLEYSGSPFDASADEVHVLRWAAHRPSLYRIPYGGLHEAAMQAMQGWVIERPPFRGNGFAPSETGDVIAEFKVDSARLPHGAQLWQVRSDGTEALLALLDADGPQWRRVEAG